MTESTISVPIPTSQFLELTDFLREQGSDRDPVEGKQEDLLPEIFTKNKGYTWKEVFLAHGTSLRMKYRGEYHYAKVDGDHVIYNEIAVSPGQFANRVTSSSRNAWRDLEVRRPEDDEWLAANHLRQQAKKARPTDL
jgi:hypothetical protein